MSDELLKLTDQPYVDLELEVEDQPKIDDPSEKAIERELSRLNNADPSFMILGRAGGSYAQTLGGPEEYVAEIRVVHDKSYEHFKVYHYGAEDLTEVHVEGSHGGVKIPERERLNKDQVLRTLVAFARNHALPADLALRNATAEFVSQDKKLAVESAPSGDNLRAPTPAAEATPAAPATPPQTSPAPQPQGVIARIRALFGF